MMFAFHKLFQNFMKLIFIFNFNYKLNVEICRKSTIKIIMLMMLTEAMNYEI